MAICFSFYNSRFQFICDLDKRVVGDGDFRHPVKIIGITGNQTEHRGRRSLPQRSKHGIDLSQALCRSHQGILLHRHLDVIALPAKGLPPRLYLRN